MWGSMATTPFTVEFEASLKQPIQGGKLELLSGHVVWPQFFCCISGTNTGVDKSPVGQIKASDTWVCSGLPTCVDILGSWSPTSTLITWAVDWGDGNNNNGGWPPGGDVCHPLGGYAVADTYDVTLTVTDLLGVTDEDIVQITVFDCPVDPLPPFCDMVGSWGSGPFYTEVLAGGATVWHGLAIPSLAAAGAKNCEVLKEYHWLDGHISVFMGTICGVFEYVVPDLPASPFSGTWVKVIDAADITGPLGIVGNLRIWDLQMVMDREGHEGWGYIAFGVSSWPDVWEGAASTRDGWQTLHAQGLAYTDVVNFRTQMCAIAQHTPTTVYVTCEDGLYRSVNSGLTYALIDGPAGGDERTVYVPWNTPGWDDRTITHMGNGGARRSTDGGGTFANLGSGGRPVHTYGPTFNADEFWFADWGGSGRVRYWDPVGGYGTFGPIVCPVGCHNDSGRVITTDTSYFPTSWLLGGDGFAIGIIKLNTAIGTIDCTGDWNAKTGATVPNCMLHRTPEPWDPGDP